MIYEFRTYTLKPGSVPEVEALFAENLPHREKFSKITAFWHTEIGPLNQIIHVWAYESAEERTKIRAESAQIPQWPPPIGKFIVNMQSDIYLSFPGMAALVPGTYGPYYEMRSYIVKPGTIPSVIEAWNSKVVEREKLSPAVAAMYTDAGTLNKFTHIWPYKTLDERDRIRKSAIDQGLWPPPTREFLVTMENKIMLPAAFSPMQ